jgi:ribonuclease Z
VDLQVTFIGTSASVPSAARGTSATLIARGGARWLVDCGEGTQRQLLRSGLGLTDVDAILLTHLHGDHFLGLPGIFKTYGLRGRARELLLVGPPGLEDLLDTLRPVIGRLPFRLDVMEAGPGAVIREDGMEMRAFHTDHGVRSLGYVMVEEDRPGVFDVDAARALGVTPGPDFGVLQRGGEVTVEDGSVVCDATKDAARGADLLVHEATFTSGDRDRAIETRHSTADEAATLARDAGVRMLALTHISTRVHPRDVKAEARGIFEATVVPRDFDQVEIPYRERGVPRLVPVQERVGKGARDDAPVPAEAAATLDDASL